MRQLLPLVQEPMLLTSILKRMLVLQFALADRSCFEGKYHSQRASHLRNMSETVRLNRYSV